MIEGIGVVLELSIIIPFHRGVHFLEDCFASVRDQGLVDYEVLLLLDHAKEDIQPMMEEYQDLPIRVIKIKEKSRIQKEYRNESAKEYLRDCTGVAHVRNIGIVEAKGEYLFFLDSDDYLLEGALLNLLKEAEEQRADFTYSKRVGTWFKRKSYLASIKEESDEEEEEEDDSDTEDQDVDSDEDEESTDESEELEEESKEVVEEEKEEEEKEEEDYVEEESNEDSSDEIQIIDDTMAPRRKRRSKREKKIYKVERKLRKHSEGNSWDVDEGDLFRKAEAYYALFVSKKGIKNVSALGVLFRRDFIIENQLTFNESYMLFTDAPFMIKVLQRMKISSYVKDAVYVKRKHNDPIHYPALSQIKIENRFEEFMEAHREGITFAPQDSALRIYLENKLISYFIGTFAPLLRRSSNDAWRTTRLEEIRQAIKEIDPDRIRKYKGYKKRALKALIKGKDKKLMRIVNFRLAKKKLKKLRKNRRLFAYYLYHHYFIKMSQKENWVLCESFLGKNYSDSPKYIYEYLSSNYPKKYRFIWIINKKGTKIPYKHSKVKRFSIRYCYYLARCKYTVFNMRQPDWMQKREGNVFLETWHGTPLKKLVFDQEEVMGATPLYKAQVYKQSRQWDYMVSANHFSTQAFKSAFLFDNKILEYGYPRNDILHHKDKDQIAKGVRKKLRIPEDKKTILYAPTWRDDEYYGKGQYKFALQLELHAMAEQLGQEYVILLRTHYFIADALDITGLEGFAWNVSKYDDVSELYLISDILITDYSSVFFDYANLQRPILFYTYDLEKYRDMLRGFYLDIEKEVPGPLLFTTQEVIDAIANIEDVKEEFKEKYKKFYQQFCSLEKGHASEKIAKEVFQLE